MSLFTKRSFRSFLLFFFSVLITGSVNLFAHPPQQQIRGALSITSPDFSYGMQMPFTSARDNENQFPTLVINNIPPGTRSLAVQMIDLENPDGRWIHWLAANIPPSYRIWTPDTFPTEAVLGTNDFGNRKYDGPSSTPGIRHYLIHVFALSKVLSLQPGFNSKKLENAMWGHILARTTLMGSYSKR